MAELLKKCWRDDFDRELSFESLEQNHFPSDMFLVATHTYPKAETIDGWMFPCKCFVLAGQVSYSNPVGNQIDLECGDYLDLPKGKYTLCVSEDSDLEIAYVWKRGES